MAVVVDGAGGGGGVGGEGGDFKLENIKGLRRFDQKY